ncbi:GNAT family N-acetyltransferase [Rhodococcus sp. NPDC060084]|uniref:GNAT family N-acetyltransferase n=1 Tax=Rhodococcus sp. NPDC060084 TaxID=3347053 RepID=UPI003652F443
MFAEQHTVSPDLVIRPLGPQDEDSVRALHEHLTQRDTYLRFFTVAPRRVDELAEMLCRQDDGHVSLGAFDDAEVVAVANYTVLDDDVASAECAVAVSHPMQHHGIGTALLQRLVEIARARGIRRLSAYVLSVNTTMLQVLGELGWSRNGSEPGSVVQVDITLGDPLGNGGSRVAADSSLRVPPDRPEGGPSGPSANGPSVVGP